MKKAAIVTLYHSNYNPGGQLQAYALQKYISELGLECNVVNLMSTRKLKKLKALSIYDIFYRMKAKLLFKIHCILNSRLKIKIEEKRRLFDEFKESIPHTNVLSKAIETQAMDYYDYWITGSDRVWSRETIAMSKLYLLEGCNGTLLSYAASGFNAVYKQNHQHINEISSAIMNFKAVSVREEGIRNILMTYNNRVQIETVLDPTMLYCAKTWDEMEIDPNSVNKKYAFVYLIHHSNQTKKNIYNYCKNNDLSMVLVAHAQGWYKKADEAYYDIQVIEFGPREWIGYIKRAEVIFTDSFHGTIYSILYQKQFWSFEKMDKNISNEMLLVLRKYNLLKKLSLLDRCVDYSYIPSNLNDDIEIDYTKVNSLLEIERDRSITFLRNALDL